MIQIACTVSDLPLLGSGLLGILAVEYWLGKREKGCSILEVCFAGLVMVTLLAVTKWKGKTNGNGTQGNQGS